MRQKILITGVSSGLGYGLAKHFLSVDCCVYGMSRRKPDDLCQLKGFFFESVDFKEPNQVVEVGAQLLQNVESLDLVVLNAGVLNGIKDMSATSIEEIEQVMRVNVWSHKVLLDELFGAGISVKQVVGISSGASISGNRGWNAYSLSKASFNMLIKLYAEERLDTHFTALAPGLIDTAMQEYISSLATDERYSKIDRIKTARGSDLMPSPEVLVPRMVEVFEQLKANPSGGFVDIRKLQV